MGLKQIIASGNRLRLVVVEQRFSALRVVVAVEIAVLPRANDLALLHLPSLLQPELIAHLPQVLPHAALLLVVTNGVGLEETVVPQSQPEGGHVLVLLHGRDVLENVLIGPGVVLLVLEIDPGGAKLDLSRDHPAVGRTESLLSERVVALVLVSLLNFAASSALGHLKIVIFVSKHIIIQVILIVIVSKQVIIHVILIVIEYVIAIVVE